MDMAGESALPFRDKKVVFELGSNVPWKRKQSLRKAVVRLGGTVSYVLTKESDILAVESSDLSRMLSSYKYRTAGKFGIPVVSATYIDDCEAAGRLFPTVGYLLDTAAKSESFSSGKITSAQASGSETTRKPKSTFNLNSVRVYQSTDVSVPSFSNDCQLVKLVYFQVIAKVIGEVMAEAIAEKSDKPHAQSSGFSFVIHEVHSESKSSFRVFSQRGKCNSNESVDIISEEYRFVSSGREALAVLTGLCTRCPAQRGWLESKLSHSSIGSPLAKKQLAEQRMSLNNEPPPPAVCRLLKCIWTDAMAELLPGISLRATTLDKLDKAESQLLSQRNRYRDNGDVSLGEDLASQLDDIQHEIPGLVTDGSQAGISRSFDFCQLIRDLISVSEATNYERVPSSSSMLRALKCGVEHLASDTQEATSVVSLVNSMNLRDTPLHIVNVYRVSRPAEVAAFQKKGETKLLFHSSKAQNFIGILLRGLLSPKVVVEDHGVTRTDAGLLGNGIYFAGHSSTSAVYSAKTSSGTRLMLVAEVAVGDCLSTTTPMVGLTEAPSGHDSLRSVPKSEDETSEFQDEEYCIFDCNQQCLKYLVEFYLPGEKDTIDLSWTQEQTDVAAITMDATEESNAISLEGILDVCDPLSKVNAGLQVGGSAVPLRAVHVCAKLIDLAAQVIVFQEYYNEGDAPIEAKYVFPLDDSAAVCGFEAYINDKHVVGVVKEKEQAHREYKEAVSKGHGAYLMDEETPDVFTVSVGNLPPHCSVKIKITYVAELAVENEKIRFSLPSSVAPWSQTAALQHETQQTTDTHHMTEEFGGCLSTCRLKSDQSPRRRTVMLAIKQTATKAVCMLKPNTGLRDGFSMFVSLAEIHVPRMWVETDESSQSQACMLTFYPEFDSAPSDDNEVYLILDCSNSMKGEAFKAAQRLVLLAVHSMPKTESWRFNVCKFGTDWEELFCTSKESADSMYKKVESFLTSATATKGGTNILQPLRSIQLLNTNKESQSSTTQTRNVFIFSDGHFDEMDKVLSCVRDGAPDVRVFTFGVGSTPNRHLLRSVARVGAGSVEIFDDKAKSKWQGKVERQLSKARQAVLTSVNVQWQQFDDNAPAPIQAPQQIVSLFSGSRQVVYGFVPNCTQAELQAVIGGVQVKTMVSTSELASTTGTTLHRLTARAIIRDWEEGALHPDPLEHELMKCNRKEYIIETSIRHSIVTQFTSFVAIEEREKGESFTEGVGPDMLALLRKEDVDFLPYVPWKETWMDTATDDDKDDFFDAVSESSSSEGSVSLMRSSSRSQSTSSVCSNQSSDVSESSSNVGSISLMRRHSRRSLSKFQSMSSVHTIQSNDMSEGDVLYANYCGDCDDWGSDFSDIEDNMEDLMSIRDCLPGVDTELAGTFQLIEDKTSEQPRLLSESAMLVKDEMGMLEDSKEEVEEVEEVEEECTVLRMCEAAAIQMPTIPRKRSSMAVSMMTLSPIQTVKHDAGGARELSHSSTSDEDDPYDTAKRLKILEHELKRTSGAPALCSLQWTHGSAPVPPSLPQQPLTGKQESSKLPGAMADSHDLMSSIRSRVNAEKVTQEEPSSSNQHVNFSSSLRRARYCIIPVASVATGAAESDGSDHEDDLDSDDSGGGFGGGGGGGGGGSFGGGGDGDFLARSFAGNRYKLDDVAAEAPMPKLYQKNESSKCRSLTPDVEPEQAVLPLAHQSIAPCREEFDDEEDRCSYVTFGKQPSKLMRCELEAFEPVECIVKKHRNIEVAKRELIALREKKYGKRDSSIPTSVSVEVTAGSSPIPPSLPQQQQTAMEDTIPKPRETLSARCYEIEPRTGASAEKATQQESSISMEHVSLMRGPKYCSAESLSDDDDDDDWSSDGSGDNGGGGCRSRFPALFFNEQPALCATVTFTCAMDDTEPDSDRLYIEDPRSGNQRSWCVKPAVDKEALKNAQCRLDKSSKRFVRVKFKVSSEVVTPVSVHSIPIPYLNTSLSDDKPTTILPLNCVWDNDGGMALTPKLPSKFEVHDFDRLLEFNGGSFLGMLNSEMKGHMFEDGQYTFSRILEAKDAAQVPNPISVVDLETEFGAFPLSNGVFELLDLHADSVRVVLVQRGVLSLGERTAYRVFSFVATCLIAMALHAHNTLHIGNGRIPAVSFLLSEGASLTHDGCLKEAVECIRTLCEADPLFRSLPNRLSLGNGLDEFMQILFFEAI